MLDGSTGFDFANEEDREESRSASDKKEILTAKPTKVSYDDGKTWIDLTQKEGK